MASVDWALLDHAAREPVRVGDMVSADAGGMPIYRVMAFEGGRALLAGERQSPARHMPLDAFRWRGAVQADRPN
ncbi:MAG: hypothetical protein JWQ29_2408 [Phenylobacterium sp.]|nr:hypothetical protein [Phenylobacterium sp.]